MKTSHRTFGPGTPPVPDKVGEIVDCDIAVIGSGMGGGTLAYALRNSGANVLVVERGDFLPREKANSSPVDVFEKRRYKNSEKWYDGSTGKPFEPGVHYYVGGNTKVYGACLPRFRAEDFGELKTHDGISPAWPVGYAGMEPYYAEAESLYGVHGNRREDPTEPPRSGDFPFPALEHEPSIAALAASMTAQGLHPVHMPMGVDIRPGGACVRTRTCDGFPCPLDAKGDADVRGVRPALLSPTVRLLTRTVVTRLHTSADGQRVVAAAAERDGQPVLIRAGKIVVAGGAVNSAALLLRSTSDRHPRGLANSSDLVGRNYMVHNSTFLVAVDPRRRNPVSFQKTLGLSDWYLAGPDHPYPLGNLQLLGKLQGSMIKPAQPLVPTWLLDRIAERSIDIYLTTEDIPDRDNRVVVGSDGRITVHWKPNNLTPHRELVRRVTRVVRRAGYPFVFTERMGIETNSHQCGTATMGTDPDSSVLDPLCRAHDVPNLWVADSSCFPSSAALNPALTIAANAFRVAAESNLKQ
jgi:choline dehydrogenase-like flavoprotein